MNRCGVLGVEEREGFVKRTKELGSARFKLENRKGMFSVKEDGGHVCVLRAQAMLNYSEGQTR